MCTEDHSSFFAASVQNEKFRFHELLRYYSTAVNHLLNKLATDQAIAEYDMDVTH